MDEAMELYRGWPISLRMFLYVVDGVIIHVQLELVDLERRTGNLVYFPHVLCFVSFMCR
jgi:hypothetical protein